MAEQVPLRPKSETFSQRLRRRFTRTKTVEEVLADQDASLDGDNDAGLKRSLTGVDLIAYGLGSTVGAGVYVTAGVAAQQYAGPGVVFSFILASTTCMFSAFCYAEFASRIPVSGSAYTFAYTSLGEAVAWFIGWNLTLEYGISASAVARGWANYVAQLFITLDHPLPTWLHDLQVGSFHLSILAVLIIVLCSALLLAGAKESARFNLVMTVVNVSIILFIIIAGSFFVERKNLTPMVRPDTGTYGIVAAAGVVFFSFVGFDAVSTLAGEVANPQRDLPIGILGTLAICTTLYIGVAIVMSGMVPYQDIDARAPLASAFNAVHAHWAAVLVGFGSITTLTATTLCSLFGQPRIYFSMAKDGLLCPIFAKLHPRTRVPVHGTLLTGVMAAVIAFALDIDALSTMISIGTLMAFATVCGSIVVLRYQTLHQPTRVLYLLGLFVAFSALFALSHFWFSGAAAAVAMTTAGAVAVAIAVVISRMPCNEIQATFKCPYVPFFPLLGLFFNVWLICGLEVESLIRLVIWTVLGFVLYLSYGMQHSALDRRYAGRGDDDRQYQYSPAEEGDDGRLLEPPTPQQRL